MYVYSFLRQLKLHDILVYFLDFIDLLNSNVAPSALLRPIHHLLQCIDQLQRMYAFPNAFSFPSLYPQLIAGNVSDNMKIVGVSSDEVLSSS